MSKKAKVIFVGNYKGGVGKTTTALYLSTWISKIKNSNNENNKVLVIDLDPQSSLSEILVSNNRDKNYQYDSKLSNVPDDHTVNFIYDISIRVIKKYHSFVPNFLNVPIKYRDNDSDFWFVPCSIYYKSENSTIGVGLDDIIQLMDDNLQYYQILPNFLNSLKDNFDYIIIDCPPTNNIITSSTFLASDWYVIPTICDGLSSNGVIHYIQKIKQIYKKMCIDSVDADINRLLFGNEPNCAGIFYNLIRAQAKYVIEKDYLKSELASKFNYKDLIYDEIINNYVDIARKTPRGIAESPDFKAIVDKIYERIK